MLRFLYTIALALFCVSCRNSSQEQVSKYYEDGMAKPVIALSPLIDTTSFEIPWSLSEEFSDLVFNRLYHKGSLFLSGHNRDPLSSSENPFGTDISWIKKQFSPNEFVVFLELVEHDMIPVTKSSDPSENSSNLNLAVRVRIVDIRGTTPKIVLQELIRESYYIGRTLIPFNYSQLPWGTDEYATSPMALAHASLIKNISERINDYILLAKSRWNG